MRCIVKHYCTTENVKAIGKAVYINHVLLCLSYLDKSVTDIDEDDLNMYFAKLHYKEKKGKQKHILKKNKQKNREESIKQKEEIFNLL